MTLTELCGYLKNYFEQKKYIGDVTIADGRVSFDGDSELLDGQYIRIVGSVFNDGVYQWKTDTAIPNLVDEAFNGGVWALAIPKELISVLAEITAWEAKYAGACASPMYSETISSNSYTYTKGNPESTKQNTAFNTFASKLNRWKKIV